MKVEEKLSKLEDLQTKITIMNIKMKNIHDMLTILLQHELMCETEEDLDATNFDELVNILPNSSRLKFVKWFLNKIIETINDFGEDIHYELSFEKPLYKITTEIFEIVTELDKKFNALIDESFAIAGGK